MYIASANLIDIFMFPTFVDEKGQSVVDLQQIAQKTFKCELPPGEEIISASPVSSEGGICVFPVGMKWHCRLKSLPHDLDIKLDELEISYAEWSFCRDNGIYSYGSIRNVYFCA